MNSAILTNVFCILIFGASYYAFQNPQVVNRFVHYPFREAHHGERIRLLSSGFIHGSWNHLLINLFVLWQFGVFVESYFNQRFGPEKGALFYLIFLLSAIVVANMGTFLRHKDNPQFRSLGASGVTSAMVIVYVLFNPWQMFIFPPIPAVLFAVLYLAYSTWASQKRHDNIDHQGHLWGALFGLGFIWLIDPSAISYFLNAVTDIPWLR